MIPVIEELSDAIQQSGMDYEKELKAAKQQAWQRHKHERYPDLE